MGGRHHPAASDGPKDRGLTAQVAGHRWRTSLSDEIDATFSGQPLKAPTGTQVLGQGFSERIRSSLSEAAES